MYLTCNITPIECRIRATISFRWGIRDIFLIHHTTAIAFPLVFNDGQQNHLSEGAHLAKDQEDVNHLDIGSGRKHLHYSHEVVVMTSMVVRLTLRAASKK